MAKNAGDDREFLSTIRAAPADMRRVARVVRALNIRLDVISAEMAAALEQRDWHYQPADALLDEVDELARSHRKLTRALGKAEQRLAVAAMRESDAMNRQAAHGMTTEAA